MYRYDKIRELKEEFLILTEGCIDTLSFLEAGFKAVTSIPDGAPSAETKKYSTKFDFLMSAEPIFDNYKQVIVAMDNDDAGRVAAKELSRRIGVEKCWRIEYPKGCKDANDVLVQHGEFELLKIINERKPYPVDGIIKPADLKVDLLNLYRHGAQGGASTGWKELDKCYTVRPGELTIVVGIPGHGKALSVETPLPTPNGWVLMKDIQEGDVVFDEEGKQCNVVGTTEIMKNRECFEIGFSDKSTIIADAEHLWFTRDNRARLSERNSKSKIRKGTGTDQSWKKTYPSAKTTREIAKTLFSEKGKRFNHFVPIQKETKCKKAKLLVGPYTLGAWLGDGHSADGRITNMDKEVISAIEKEAYCVKKQKAKYAYGIRGLKVQLRELDVLNNKHIPIKYLFCSKGQRLDLLKGLMDTDGHCQKQRGTCEYYSTNKVLALDVLKLIRSLGILAQIREKTTRIKGKDCGICYTVAFTPPYHVFKIERKRRLQKLKSKFGNWKAIVSCKKVMSVPVKCIKVDSSKSLYLAGESFTVTHNSTFCDALMVNLIKNEGWRFAVFSPENWPSERHLQTIIENMSGKTFSNNSITSKKITEAEVLKCNEKLDQHISFIVPKEEIMTVDAILEKARVEIFRHGVRGVIIDPWNEIEHDFGGLSETQYISKSLSKIRRFARQHDVHIWQIAHPTKLKVQDGEKNLRPPSMYDISGGANWRNKADNGLCVYRPDYKNDATNVMIQKIRFREVGQLGMVKFDFCRDTNQYFDTECESLFGN